MSVLNRGALRGGRHICSEEGSTHGGRHICSACHCHTDMKSPLALLFRYSYFRKHGHATICMPASWRSSTGDDPLDEIRALAGTDRWFDGSEVVGQVVLVRDLIHPVAPSRPRPLPSVLTNDHPT